jgi:hypothetical protein
VYFIQVIYPDLRHPHEVHKVERAADALALIPQLLEAHSGCERIAVYAGTSFLFAVDCKGNRLPG